MPVLLKIGSHFSVVLVVSYWIVVPVWVAKLLFWSRIPEAIFSLWMFLALFSMFYLILCSLEIAVIKYLVIVIYKHMFHVVDDFFASFFFMTNLSLSGLLSLVDSFSKEALHYKLLMSRGLPRFLEPLDGSTPITETFIYVILIGFTIIFAFLSIAIHIEK